MVVQTETVADGVLLVRLNRPDARNALNMELRTRLAEVFLALADDPAVRCVVVTGSPKVFAAGADIKEMAESGAIEMMGRRILRLWKPLADCPKPVIAAVNGVALGGGCELAMHADIIVAGEGARFGQPEVKVGIMPGGGATQRLVRAVGVYRAMRMMLTGEPVTAAEALSMGLVSEVVADDTVLDRALEMARAIAAMPPLAVQQIKETVYAGLDGSLAGGLLLERKAFEILFASADQKEGMRAFIEKRSPTFEGK
ncbi:enoyl-CoA hydratase [Azospirillum sp. RWY-5-1]|uniref:Enoyl-CoA hydratase n=1 Tax=Azospirillum oleiclasticum TaxID=2735135 RepID=A0ABX2TDQ1_9PROT|nr:enoyl-CoA hydratase-related protein [Azospirillum oleiclasticum]NYZ13916.1 enoyl-CoA hydratase [Azospirillum oleiclasticum]NYZ20840.1 enoyl-CoA hydratase [Azospirillum oleiclasticum]